MRIAVTQTATMEPYVHRHLFVACHGAGCDIERQTILAQRREIYVIEVRSPGFGAHVAIEGVHHGRVAVCVKGAHAFPTFRVLGRSPAQVTYRRFGIGDAFEDRDAVHVAGHTRHFPVCCLHNAQFGRFILTRQADTGQHGH